jgi:hypothetical protein
MRRDIIGVRDLSDGRKEYLMHNEALCRPHYLAVSAPPAVPAQEAPVCLCPVNWYLTKGFHFVSCPLARPAEPQTGAQVPGI